MKAKEFLSIQRVPLRELPLGELFTLNEPSELEDVNERKVWVRSDYDRTSKKYLCYKWADVNHETAMRGERLVWVGFTF